MRYLLVTGGVISGLGKGITASSLGVLFNTHGCKVTAIKIDPYLNQDSGTMNPFEHGECYVLADGGETDLDLGSYERFLGVKLSRDNNITTGKIYQNILNAERKGEFLGKTVQVVPHITNAIKDWIHRVSVKDDVDLCILELGGTVGDIESLPFLEALRQMSLEENHIFCHVHVSYLPILKTTDEIKTKPTQVSVQNVRMYGLPVQFLCLRCESEIPDQTIEKIRLMTGVQNILRNVDISNIYSVPVNFYPTFSKMWKYFNFSFVPINKSWTDWIKMAEMYGSEMDAVSIAIVGKYTGLRDSYLSLTHAIMHASFHLGKKPEITFIDAENVSATVLEKFKGVIIPGGFGNRGVPGMIETARYCRVNKIPLLGICLGMQVMVIEWARNVLNISSANSTEFDQDADPKILLIMAENENLGGTMRLGESEIFLLPNSQVRKIYGLKEKIVERHRHRYEVNPDYHHKLADSGLTLSGMSDNRVEIVENSQNKFYLGVQFHPEYQTYPWQPHPVFTAWINSVI